MARDVFYLTLSNALLIDMPSGPDYDDMLQALEGVQVSVYERGTTTPVTIYQRPTGATQGPTPESGASGGPNPFLTGPAGNIEFWADGPKEIDVFLHDTILPNRVSDRTFGWNATAVGPSSLPTSMLAGDAGIGLGSLGPDVLRQMHQIGQVIDWWRPAVSVPIPPGWEVCDGHQVPAGSHDFPGLGGAAINLPDLRNTFVIGAAPSTEDSGRPGAPSVISPFKTLGAGAGQGDPAANAPGIAGSGGSNASKSFAHGHGVPGVDHLHYSPGVDHLHGSNFYTGGHSHGLSGGTGTEYQGALGRATGGGTCAYPYHTHPVSGGTDAPGNLGVYGTTAAADRVLGANTQGSDRSLATATNSLTWTTDPGGNGLAVDFRPKFIGLLKLMKVRRT